MSSIKKILTVFDPTSAATLEDQPAVQRAADLCRELSADLEIFACVYDQYLSGQRFLDSPGLSESRKACVAVHLKHAKVLADEVRAGGVAVSAAAAWDTPLSDGIVRRAMKAGTDLVVKATHRHARLQRVIFTNTDWHLLRDCPVPLLLVKPGQGSRSGPVIAAVDPLHDADQPAELDQEIIDAAKMMSSCQGSELHLFHAYQTILTAPTGIAVGLEPIMLPVEVSEENIKKAHEKAFNKLRLDAAVAEDRAHLVAGETRASLLDLVADLDASLVVMGVIARGVLKRLFIGSTAEQVLGDVACDVLVVKPSGFKSPVKEV